jgi:hypothetical protein
MTKFQFLTLLAAGAFTFAAGCDSQKAASNVGAADSGEHVHQHDHEDGTVHHGHEDHSVEGHTHGKGPHGGTIADWGGGAFHVEFIVDHDKQEATAYVLGTDEKTPTPIDAEEITLSIKDPAFTVALKPSPQDGESKRTFSRFVGNHENLGIAKRFEGSMSGVVAGTPYSGNFKESADDK